MRASAMVSATLVPSAPGLTGGPFCGSCYAHSRIESAHDDELTVDAYDGTVSCEAAPDAVEAAAPVEVHEFDIDAVKAGGGVREIDFAHDFQIMLRGQWLVAMPEQRFLELLAIQDYLQHLPNVASAPVHTQRSETPTPLGVQHQS